MVKAGSFQKMLPASLRGQLEALPALAVAYSGGLDSRFLCHAALLCGCGVMALHVTGPHIPDNETRYARAWAEKNGLDYQELELDVLSLADVRQNTRQRCYACKSFLFAALKKRLGAQGKNSLLLCDGGNADDYSVFRPGLRAVKEHGVRSPLATAGLTKAGLRRLAARTGMDNPEQKARPCLLTRFDYGVAPTKALLARVAEAEMELASFLPQNVDFRLRLAPEPELHLESGFGLSEDLLKTVLRKYGFANAQLRIQPEISGFFDRKSGSPEA